MDYSSRRWQLKREHILKRDQWTDQVALQKGSKLPANLVHHILPADEFPEYQYADWNLIAVSDATHRQLHDRVTGDLTNAGRELAQQTAAEHGVKLHTVTLVIGMPGSGKSTWARRNLKGGLCFELDAIACAFRLTVPHNEPPNIPARRMAAALRKAFIAAAPRYTAKLMVVRSAPDIDEIAETNPDRLVVCWQEYARREYEYTREEYKRRIAEAEEWARLNGVEIIYNPDKSDIPPGL